MNMPSNYRTPIVSLLGHVDHGKTSILESLSESTSITESGNITQTVRTETIDRTQINSICSKISNFDTGLPGVIFIDTPGHRSFSKSRSVGSEISDIALVTVDITEGIQPQTEEVLEDLNESNRPFVVCANKIDTIPEWNSDPDSLIQDSFENQSSRCQERVMESIYSLVGKLSNYNIDSDVFWNIRDFTQTVGIVPISAKTTEGIPELVSVILGLCENYLSGQMIIDESDETSGYVLAKTHVDGFGESVEVVLEQGELSVGDNIYSHSNSEAIETSVEHIFEYLPTSDEVRERKSISAASVPLIICRNMDMVSGACIKSSPDSITARTDESNYKNEGIIVNADSYNNLNALKSEMNNEDIPVAWGSVGTVTKSDVMRSQTMESLENRVILSFRTEISNEAQSEADDNNIEIVSKDIIYEIKERVEDVRRERLDRDKDVVEPCSFTIIDDGIIKSGNPSIIGVEIKNGLLETGREISTFTGGREKNLGQVKRIEKNRERQETATRGERVSISVDKNSDSFCFEEGVLYYVRIPKEDVSLLQSNLDEGHKMRALDSYIESKQELNPFWS